MSTTTFEGMSLDEMQAAYQAMQAALREAKASEDERLAAALTDTFTLVADDLVSHTQEKVSETSGWQGHSYAGLPVTLSDGRTVTVSVTVTTVKGTRKAKKAS